MARQSALHTLAVLLHALAAISQRPVFMTSLQAASKRTGTPAMFAASWPS